jgi:hypothetical protein
MINAWWLVIIIPVAFSVGFASFGQLMNVLDIDD